MSASDNSKPRVVIIGAGFGGAYTAKYLYKRLGDKADIELINDTNYFVFQPLLPEVASGTINAQDAVTPLRLMIPGVRSRMAEVRSIQFNEQCVQLVQGSKRRLLECHYDHLVIANGQATNLSFLPGFTEHSLTLKNLADAHHLRNVVIERLEHADVTEDAELKKRLLTFVVAGGGFSGVETIGEMSEMIRRTLKYYPNISPDELQGILVQRGDRILPELPPELAKYAHQQLQRRGVKVMLNCGLKSASATAVELDSGEKIYTTTLVSTIGNGPAQLVLDLQQQQGLQLEKGKIITQRSLQVQGQDNVWSVGDAALIPMVDNPKTNSDYAPPTAQYAVREARCLADNITASIRGQKIKPFQYKPRGSLASIGNYKAVAKVFGIRFSGVIAWSMWRGFYMLMLPGFVTKMRVALNWFLDYFVPRTTVQVNNNQARACRYVRYCAGDVVFVPNQIADGFYVVAEGQLEASRKNSDGQLEVRTLNPGDHWGDRVLSNNMETTGYLKAVSDSKVLVLSRDDFVALQTTLPPINHYLKNDVT